MGLNLLIIFKLHMPSVIHGKLRETETSWDEHPNMRRLRKVLFYNSDFVAKVMETRGNHALLAYHYVYHHGNSTVYARVSRDGDVEINIVGEDREEVCKDLRDELNKLPIYRHK